jgi:N-acetylmuramoyl-L-alanine amidase CwlA
MPKYPITQDFLQVGKEHNRPGTPLAPQGLTVHETATPGASSSNESAYFHNAYREASAHFFVDYSAIVQIIPENEIAWHAGPTANHRDLSVELCHFTDPEKFQETWKRGVWLAADICLRYGFDPGNIYQMHTHAWVSETWGETDHTDPIGYFTAHGKSWADFVAAVINEMEEISMAKLIDKYPNWYDLGVQALKNLEARGVFNSSEQHIEILKKAGENDQAWLGFVGLDRIAEKAGIKKKS